MPQGGGEGGDQCEGVKEEGGARRVCVRWGGGSYCATIAAATPAAQAVCSASSSFDQWAAMMQCPGCVVCCGTVCLDKQYNLDTTSLQPIDGCTTAGMSALPTEAAVVTAVDTHHHHPPTPAPCLPSGTHTHTPKGDAGQTCKPGCPGIHVLLSDQVPFWSDKRTCMPGQTIHV